MRKIINEHMYFFITLAFAALTATLNSCTKLVICSAIYVLLALTANLMSEFYGKKKAMLGIIFSILVNIIWMCKTIDMVLIGSFISVLISLYCGINLSAKLKETTNFHVRNFIALFVCGVVDSMAMCQFLVIKFPMAKCLSMCFIDIVFKSSYSLIASACLCAVFYLLRHNNPRLRVLSEL